MRIALIGYEANIANRVGSNEYAFELLTHIEKIDKENDYVVYLPQKPLSDLPKPRKGWQYKVAGPKKLWNFLGLSLALFKDRKNIDLIFSPGHYAPPFVFGKPLAISIMDLGFLRYPKQFTRPILFKLRVWTYLSVKKANHVFAISNSTKNDIIGYYKKEKSKITVTYLGFDSLKFNGKAEKEEIERVKAKYKIKNKYILFLSTLKPNKNIEGLIKAYSKISEKTSESLVIAGRKGWMFEEIYKLVKKLKLEKKVIFTDFVDEKDVSGLISGASIFALPSFWEGFGIPAVQAMASAVPVLVSDRGSLPEVVGDAGEIVNPEDLQDISEKLLKLLSDKRLRDEKIKKGLVQAQKFSWENCAKQTIRKLKEVKNAL